MWTRRRLGWLSWLIIIWFYEISWDHDENKNHILPLFAFVWLSRKAVTVECTERPKKLNTWINRSLRSEIWVLIFLLSLSLTYYLFGAVFWKVHYLFCIFNRIHTEVFISEGPVKSGNESMKADICIMAHCVLFVTGAPIKDLSTEKYWGETWLPSWLHLLWFLNPGSSLIWVMQWWWQWSWRWWR